MFLQDPRPWDKAKFSSEWTQCQNLRIRSVKTVYFNKWEMATALLVLFYDYWLWCHAEKIKVQKDIYGKQIQILKDGLVCVFFCSTNSIPCE